MIIITVIILILLLLLIIIIQIGLSLLDCEYITYSSNTFSDLTLDTRLSNVFYNVLE